MLSHAKPSQISSQQLRSPDRKVDHVIDLVPPDEASEGETFELDDQNVRQTPQQELLGGLSVLLALWTVPGSREEKRSSKFSNKEHQLLQKFVKERFTDISLITSSIFQKTGGNFHIFHCKYFR